MNLEEFSFLSIFLERFNLFPFYAYLPVLLNARLEVIDVLCSRSDEQLLTFINTQRRLSCKNGDC